MCLLMEQDLHTSIFLHEKWIMPRNICNSQFSKGEQAGFSCSGTETHSLFIEAYDLGVYLA